MPLLTKKDIFDHTANEFQRAVKLFALAHNSDPFASNRVSMEMRKGFRFPSEVIADATQLLNGTNRGQGLV